MSVRVACPNCEASYGLDESYVGRETVCPVCGQTFSVAGTQVDNRLGPGPAGGDGPTVPQPTVGEVFAGRYAVESKLGAGGMGAVFRAVDLMLDRPVALRGSAKTYFGTRLER